MADNNIRTLCGDWRTKSIHPRAKYLFLGSFTSEDGLKHYYYCSESNDFYYLLDYAKIVGQVSDEESLEPKDLKKIIKSRGKFVRLRDAIYQSADKDAPRKSLHDLLNTYEFDICDLFQEVDMEKPNSSDDSNINLKSGKTVVAIDCLKTLKDSNIKTIYCTSKYVRDQFLRINREYGLGFVGDVVVLPSPSRNYKKRFIWKCNQWHALLNK